MSRRIAKIQSSELVIELADVNQQLAEHLQTPQVADSGLEAVVSGPIVHTRSDVAQAYSERLGVVIEAVADGELETEHASAEADVWAALEPNPLPTTQQFMAEHEVPEMFHDALEEVRELVIIEHIDQLHTAIDDDALTVLSMSPQHKMMTHHIPKAVVTIRQALRDTVSQILIDLPAERVARYNHAVAVTEYIGQIASDEAFVLVTANGGSETTASGKELAQTAHELSTNKHLQQLTNTLLDLKASPAQFALLLESQFGATVENQVRSTMRDKYQRRIQACADSLPIALSDAFEAYLDDFWTTETYVPPTVVEPEQPEAAPTQEVYTITELGTVATSFEWLPSGDPMAVRLVQDHGMTMLVCDALSPNARAISDKIRSDKGVASHLDALCERLVRAEAAYGGTQRIPGVGMIQGRRAPAYEIHPIFKVGNIAPNAKRVYYSRTRASQYPELAQLVKEQGLDSDTTVIAIIGQVDKAHQLKLYEEFGINRGAARAGNAGSI